MIRPFPLQRPDCPEDSPLMGSYSLLVQKWDREQMAHEEFQRLTAPGMSASIATLRAQEHTIRFAEEETERASQLFIDEARAYDPAAVGATG